MFAGASRNRALRLFYNDVYEFPLPATHRFPMDKYRLVREQLQRELEPSGLASFAVSPLATVEELSLAHDPAYINSFLRGTLEPMHQKRIGFPWTAEGVDRALSSVGGTVAAARAVCEPLQEGAEPLLFAGHLAGGTHHAFADRGEGYCVFSDIAVAARNGNAAIFQNDPHVHTASMHCAGNYFSEVEVSDSDLEVPVGAGDQEYLDLLDAWLPDVIDAAEPDLIFYQGGVDVCSADRLGKLKLTPAGVIARDDRVYSAAVEASTKLVVTMGGGYPRDLTVGSDAYEELINVHCNVYRRAAVNMQQAEYAAARRRQEYRKDGW
eukprot:gene20924-4537_t